AVLVVATVRVFEAIDAQRLVGVAAAFGALGVFSTLGLALIFQARVWGFAVRVFDATHTELTLFVAHALRAVFGAGTARNFYARPGLAASRVRAIRSDDAFDAQPAAGVAAEACLTVFVGRTGRVDSTARLGFVCLDRVDAGVGFARKER